jgi:serine/threonine-protein kinase
VAARIARGAIGSVYVCRKVKGEDPNRLLTLKVIRQHTLHQDLAEASFRREVRVGSLFRHPNAQTVIDTGIYDGQRFLIFEYVDGACLAEMMVGENRPSPAVVVAIVLETLTALQALHDATDAKGRWLGLVHCDISPENVLVGVDGVTRLSDFGSARLTAISNQAQTLGLCKPSYMPPEQFRGEKLDSRSDLYSLGVLLWTALTGRQPFTADTFDEVATKVLRMKVSPPSAHGGPACLDDVCMQAMNRSPEGRFLVASAMAAALRTSALANNLIESPAGVGEWVRRNLGDRLAERHRLIEAVLAAGAKESAEVQSRASDHPEQGQGGHEDADTARVTRPRRALATQIKAAKASVAGTFRTLFDRARRQRRG